MELGLYVHFPFCKTRCPYCDFVTTDREDLTRLHRAGYVAMLKREWALLCDKHPGLSEASVRSVFFGGGTPNLMEPDEVAALLDTIAPNRAETEITLEMNPGVTDAAKMNALREAGVTRASIGVQSTDDTLLKTLGRDHSAKDARNAFDLARAAGFGEVNVDLIFAIPGQTLPHWEKTLREVITWKPDHISAYNLTAKDQTPLAAMVRRGEVELPDEDTAAAMFMASHQMLAEAGFEQYEISNFAQPGHRCRHNADVWAGVDYLGIGLGAHSCFGGLRFANTAAWEDYHRSITEGTLPQRIDERDEDDILAERLYLGLRTVEGIDLTTFPAKWRNANREKFTALTKENLATQTGDQLALTMDGWMVGDAVVASLL